MWSRPITSICSSLTGTQGCDSQIHPPVNGGKTAQEYNGRKHGKGAFREDRYPATAVESGEHLRQCLVYMELNMVRAGVVEHPSQWPFGGYNEIRKPRRKCRLIDHEQLRELLGFSANDEMIVAHRLWVEYALMKGKMYSGEQMYGQYCRGQPESCGECQNNIGDTVQGRKMAEAKGACDLREPEACIVSFLGSKTKVLPMRTPTLGKIVFRYQRDSLVRPNASNATRGCGM